MTYLRPIMFAVVCRSARTDAVTRSTVHYVRLIFGLAFFFHEPNPQLLEDRIFGNCKKPAPALCCFHLTL